MKLTIIAIYDRITESYKGVAPTNAIGGSMRDFHDALTDPKTEISKHPEHYELHELGTWDDTTGRFTNKEEIRKLALGSDILQKTQ